MNNSKFRKILIKGPPNNLRWMLWMTAAKMAYLPSLAPTANEQPSSHDITVINGKLYKCLLSKKLKDKRKQQILNDIASCDTFPFKDHADQEHLMFNILKAMCLYDDKLKYMKGMDVISGYFLTVSDLNEEQTFLMMRYFYSSEYGIKFRTCLFPNSYRINLFCFTMNELLLERFPNIHNKIIKRMNIASDLWYGKWVKSLFWTQFPLGICVRFWDCLVGCGLVYVYNLILGIVRFSERRIEQCEDEEEFLKCFEYDLSTDEKVVKVRERIIEFGREFTISKELLEKIEEMFKESDEYRYNTDMDMEDEKNGKDGDDKEEERFGNERNRIKDLLDEVELKEKRKSKNNWESEGDENEEDEDAKRSDSDDGEDESVSVRIKGRRRMTRRSEMGYSDNKESEVSDDKRKKRNNVNDDDDSMEVNSEHVPSSLSNINLSYLNEEYYNVKESNRNEHKHEHEYEQSGVPGNEQTTNEVTLIKDGIQNDSRLSDVSLDDL